jgi:hypothetical protein
MQSNYQLNERTKYFIFIPAKREVKDSGGGRTHDINVQ